MDHLNKPVQGVPQTPSPHAVAENNKITPLGKTKSGGAAKIDAA